MTLNQQEIQILKMLAEQYAEIATLPEQENRRKYGLYYKEEEAIYQYLKSTGKRMTVTELAEEFNMSNQRTSTVVTSLVKKGKLARYVDKRKAYFEAVD